MLLDRFRELLNDSVTYLYPNIEISSTVEFSEECYAQLLDDGTMNVKGDLLQPMGFNIKRDQPFLPSDQNLLEIFFKEMISIESYALNPEYVETLRNAVINKAIASTLSSISSETVSKVINALSHYSERTYEGNNISYGIIINDVLKCTSRANNVFLTEFIEDNYAAVLTNGTESFVEVDSDGYIIRYLQLNGEKSDLGLAPYDYTRILEYCGRESIGVVLTNKGEILIFHDNELKYTKKGGRWNPYSHKETIRIIHDRSENDNLLFSKAVYLTSLDLSFSNVGGIISFLDENEVKNALRHINIKDIVNEKYYQIKLEQMLENNEPEALKIKDLSYDEFLKLPENGKSCMINRIIGGRKFFMLYRKLRQELVAIDGATIIDYNGDIVAIGAIVKIEAGSKGGGRIAAARTLSQYGISIEISSDASIRGFALDEHSQPEAIFRIADFEQ